MATQTMFSRLEDAPGIREVQARRAPVLAKLAAARARLDRVSAVLNPIDATMATRAERLRCSVASADLTRQVQMLEADDADYARAEAAARESAFDELRQRFEQDDLRECELP